MGESSTRFSMNKSLSFPSYSSSREESGWTKYFDDFSQEENERSFAFSDNYGGSSSMASDAASSVGWKLNCRVRSSAPFLATDQRNKKSSFKKRNGVVTGDDPLEDTASSPVNSPKVSDLQKKGMKLIRRDGDGSNSQEAGSCSFSEFEEVERNDLGFIGNDCTELKKRGLCLVPLSTLVNFLR